MKAAVPRSMTMGRAVGHPTNLPSEFFLRKEVHKNHGAVAP